MKTSRLLKAAIFLPVIIFTDYVIMVIIGCATCLFGFGNDFYCGSYCLIGKIILGLSAILFLLLVFPELKRFKKS